MTMILKEWRELIEMAVISWTEESHGKPRAEYPMPQLRFELSLPKYKPKM
jgi:hypothetical protein